MELHEENLRFANKKTEKMETKKLVEKSIKCSISLER